VGFASLYPADKKFLTGEKYSVGEVRYRFENK
jgi:hypothetical protein